ncbi:MAG TPA: SGNH/GDSL hydrolase family protein [Urbifossiella sp.]|nr:SGNH/GDSL hydrolase family protein [Urbifossiella sp.]
MFLPAALVVASLAPAAPKFEIKDGDRIVWIGSTLVEREQRYGYWETALHAAFPDKQFTLRNLGWSGDTVFGEARGRFDFNNPNACFKQLVGLTLELKPTVIFVSYGTNESFEGEPGLPKFEKGLNKLLDALKPAKARVVLFTPMPVFVHEMPLLDGAPRNKTLKTYSKAIGSIADKRRHVLADLYGSCFTLATTIGPLFNPGKDGKAFSPPLLTEYGVQLTKAGYSTCDYYFLVSLGLKKNVGISPKLRATNQEIRKAREELRKKNEELREAIVAKNQLFFYRWRPQNETYLFGFRKHEQGKNAREVAEFDPLVAKAEERIESLRKKLK